MFIFNNKLIQTISLCFVIALMSSCERNEFGSIRTFINGQELEQRITDVSCYNDFQTGGANPVTCSMFIRTNSFYADVIHFEITDAVSIFDQYLGIEKDPFGPPRVNIYPEVNNQPYQVIQSNQTYVLFSAISNFVNGQVCMEFYLPINAGSNGAVIQGDFCARVDG